MRNLKSYILSLLTIFLLSFIVRAQTSNQIEGRVADENNKPVYNAFVELYNDFDLLISRARSSSQGRFTFRNLRPGRYVVRIKPYTTNLLEGSESVELRNFGTIPDFQYVDIQLKVDRRGQEPTETIVGVIYAQEVPDAAKSLYTSGVKKLKSRNDQAMADLEEAIKIFPKYFDALSLLGREYIAKGKYAQGYPLLIRAIDVYKQCPECYYSLAVAFYKLKEIEAAIKAAKAAVMLKNSGDTQLLLGMVLLTNKDFAESEKALLAAKELYKDSNPEVYWQLGILYNNTKRNKEAVDELETYLKLKTDLTSEERKRLLDLINKLKNAQ